MRRDIIEAAVYIRFDIGEANFNDLVFDMIGVPSKTNLGLILFGAKSKPLHGRMSWQFGGCRVRQ